MKNWMIWFVLFGLIFSACSHSSQAKALKRSQTPPPNVALELKDANQMLAQKRCTEAITAYQKFLQKYPRDAGAWNLIGLAYLCDSKSDQAIQAFQQALAISPSYTDVHNNLGVTYIERKNYDLARKEFMLALSDTNYPVAGPYFNLARLSFNQANYEESRALSKKVIAITPKEPGPHLLYCLSLEKLGRANEATEAYRELLKLSPDNIEATYYLANLLLKRNQNCEARQLFSKVIDADPLGDLGQKSIVAIKSIHCQN